MLLPLAVKVRLEFGQIVVSPGVIDRIELVLRITLNIESLSPVASYKPIKYVPAVKSVKIPVELVTESVPSTLKV